MGKKKTHRKTVNKKGSKSKSNIKYRTIEVCYDFLQMFLDIFINLFLFLIIIILPFYFTQGYARIGTDKSMLLYYSSFIIWAIAPFQILSVCLKVVITKTKLKEFLQDFSITDIFMLCYGVAVILSHLSTNYRSEAWRGAQGWFLGTTTQLLFVCIYFLVSRTWKRKNWMLASIIPVTGIVFFIGILNRFGIYPIDMKIYNDSFISTIGNINWYCGYIVTVIFGIVYLYWHQEKLVKWQKIALVTYIVLGFCALVTQGSDSGIVALIAILFFIFLISAKDRIKIYKFSELLFLFTAVCLFIYLLRQLFPESYTFGGPSSELLTNHMIIIAVFVFFGGFYAWVRICTVKGKLPMPFFNVLKKCAICLGAVAVVLFIALIIFNTANPGVIKALEGSTVFTFHSEWGSKRGATWIAGAWSFRDQGLWGKLVGVGPDCMPRYIYEEGSAELLEIVHVSFPPPLVLTNAHNEWLTVLVNLGLLGFIGFVGVTVTSIYRFIKRSLEESGLLFAIVGVCGIGVLAYTVNNMFSFQQAMNGATIYVILGVGENIMRSLREKK